MVKLFVIGTAICLLLAAGAPVRAAGAGDGIGGARGQCESAAPGKGAGQTRAGAHRRQRPRCAPPVAAVGDPGSGSASLASPTPGYPAVATALAIGATGLVAAAALSNGEDPPASP